MPNDKPAAKPAKRPSAKPAAKPVVEKPKEPAKIESYSDADSKKEHADKTRNKGDQFEMQGLTDASTYKVQKSPWGTLILSPDARGVVSRYAGEAPNEEDVFLKAVNVKFVDKKEKGQISEIKLLKSQLARLKNARRITAQYKDWSKLTEDAVRKDMSKYVGGMLIMGDAYLRNTILVVGDHTPVWEIHDLKRAFMLKDVVTEKQYSKKYKEVADLGNNSISVQHWGAKIDKTGDWKSKKEQETQIKHDLGDAMLVKRGFKLMLANVLKYTALFDHGLDVMDHSFDLASKPSPAPKGKDAQRFVDLDDLKQHRLERELWTCLEYYAPHYFMYISSGGMNPSGQDWMKSHFNSKDLTQKEFVDILKRGKLYEEVFKGYGFKVRTSAGLASSGKGEAEDFLTSRIANYVNLVKDGKAEVSHYGKKSFIKKFERFDNRLKLASAYIRQAHVYGMESLRHGSMVLYQYVTGRRN